MSLRLIILMLVIPVIGNGQNADIRILETINKRESHAKDKFWKFTSDSDIYISIASPVSMLTYGYIAKDSIWKKNGWLSLGSFGISTAFTLGLKYSINRPRPGSTYSQIHVKDPAGSPSFPSGHTSSAFATATALSLSAKKWYITLPAFIWAGSVGYSRMYLGVHYPSDVLGGIVVGIGSGFLMWKIDKWMRN